MFCQYAQAQVMIKCFINFIKNTPVMKIKCLDIIFIVNISSLSGNSDFKQEE